MKKPKYRLSPNEVERLVKEERERRRKLRIVQVREQAKASASAIRNDVRKEKERLLNKFSSEVEEQLTAEKDEKVRKLRQKYEGTLRGIGDGHREAYFQGDGYSTAEQLQRQQEAEEAAQDRFASALKKQRLEDAAREHEQRRHIMARHAALEIERERATEIASLPPPAPDICLDMDKKSRRAVQMMDMQAFATSHYHIPDYQVVRAGPHEQTDAKSEAEDTDLRLKQDLAEKKRSLHEQKERARIRGNEALQKEMLKHDLGDMLQDLSLLQRQDRRRRQKVLADVPKQVFIPPERCLEERQERQTEMERKFDELYMQQYNERGSGELQSIEISEYPTSQDSASASIHESADTVDAIIPMSRINPALRDLTNVNQQREITKGKEPDSILKQLLTKIRSQRDAPTGSASHVTSAGPDDPHLAKPVAAAAKTASAANKLDSGSIDRPVAGNLNLSQFSHTGSSLGGKGQASHSDLDSEAVAANDKMIEELMKRIKLIELQKQKLSQQFEAHAGALDSLLRPARPDSGARSVEALSDTTLKEVDIDSETDKATDSVTDHAGLMSGDQSRQNIGDIYRRPRDVEQEVSSPCEDLSAAVSKLRPVAGILKGEKNLQYELLTSNGFLPSPEFTSMAKSGDSQGGREETSKIGHEIDVQIKGLERGGGGDAEASRQTNAGDIWGGARQEIDFGVKNGENLRKQLFGVNQSLSQFDSGDSGFRHSSGVAGERFTSSLMDSNRGAAADTSSMMSEKVLQYAEKAGERHAGLDEETAQRVRDYQQQLLQKQSDRRDMLAQVRADIEARRRQLYSSKQSFLGDSKSEIPGENFGTGMLGSSGENHQRPRDFGEGSVFGAVGQANMQTKHDPLEGRGGLLLSSWTSRHQEKNLQSDADETSAYSSSKWEPVKPFIADPGRYTKQKTSAPTMVQPQTRHIYRPWDLTSRGYPSNVKKDSKDLVEKVDSAGLGTRLKDGTKGKDRKDKVRKSLSFEEKEAGNEAADISQVSWKDVLNESATSGRAWGTSEEEESSSPLLARSHTSLDNSGRGADKSSDISVGDKSSVLTGSSSLNGSALVVRAEERRVGFERRQAELKQQLMDIQQQKDSILQRYQTGQAALHQQQAALREKLLVAASGGTHVAGEATTASGAARNSQSSAASVGTGKDRQGSTQTWAASLAQGNRQNPEVKSSSQPKYGEQTNRTSDTISPSNMDMTHSGRQSLASAGTPVNISGDSFLTDISYYKLKNGDQPSLPTAAFQLQPEGSVKAPFTISGREISASSDGQRQTWATLLQTASGSLQAVTGDDVTGRSDAAPAFSKSKVSGLGAIFPQKSASPSPPSGCESPSSSPTPLGTASESVYTAPVSLADHQPHELSTIMEVDTPTSSSTKRYGQPQKQRHLLEQGTASASNSSQSLSSQASSIVQGSRGCGGGAATGGALVIDKFPELPYTFSRPGTVFDLTTEGHKTALTRESMTPANLSNKAADYGGLARRSINFSKESSAATQNYRVQPVVEQTKQDDKDDDEIKDDEDDLLSTSMPFLVENTPSKSVPPPTADLSSDMSSLQISGYSEYLKGQTAPTAAPATSTENTEIDRKKDRHEAARPISEELALAEGFSFNPEELQVTARNTDQFGPEMVQHLRQQSRDVFGDSAEALPGREEGGSQNQSALFVEEEEVGGHMSLGNRSSLPSTDLYEISIQDTTDEEN